MEIIKVFLDSNIFFSAAYSGKGASFFLFSLEKERKIKICTSIFVLQEAERALIEKGEKECLLNFYQIIRNSHLEVLAKPQTKIIKICQELIHSKDLNILASALESKCQLLVTLDKKHFFTSKLAKTNFPFQILLPKDFLLHFRKSSPR